MSTIQFSSPQKNEFDISKLATLLGLGSRERFSDILTEVSSKEDANFVSKSDKENVYGARKKEEDPDLTQEKATQKKPSSEWDVASPRSLTDTVISPVHIEKAVMHLLSVVPQAVSIVFAQRGLVADVGVRHVYQLSPQLSTPLNVAFEQFPDTLKITLCSHGELFSILSTHSDELLKRLKKSLNRNNIELTIQKDADH